MNMRLAAGLLAPLLLLGACGDPDTEGAEPPRERMTSQTKAQTEPEKPERDRDRERESQPEKKPQPKPKPRPEKPDEEKNSWGATVMVTRIVDGDTLELGNGETVRVVGIDTPEVGQCGYDQAAEHLASLVLFEPVRLTLSDENTDHYGRLLRYVDVKMDGRVVDAGLNQIRSGFAIARYDSRDGYGYHPREPEYIRSDHATPQFAACAPVRTGGSDEGSDGGDGDGGGGACHPGYRPCLPITADLDCADLSGPVAVLGDDPYALDADGDGSGCDS